MSIQDKWMTYCSYEPRYATQDDWFNFVNEIYTKWLDLKIKNDSKCDLNNFLDNHNYIEENYGFERFMESAPEFSELQKLDPNKFRL